MSRLSRVMIVGGGPFQLDIIRAAAAMGSETVVVDRNPEAPGLSVADHPHTIDTADAGAVVELARSLSVDAVVTAASDVAVGTVAAVVDACGLPGIGTPVATRCRDKLETFRHLEQSSLRVPTTIAVCTPEDARRAAAELGDWPLVVKPRSAAGGRGVSMVWEENQLDAALARASRYASADRSVLMQAFVGGISIGAETFFVEGELVATFLMDDQYEPGFVSPAGHSLPTILEPAIAARVVEDVASFGAALGLHNGPANFDLRWVDGATVLIEVNARLGGNSITDLLRAAHSVDLSRAAVSAALGRDPTTLLLPRDVRPTAARLLLTRARRAVSLPRRWPWDGDASVLAVDLFVSEGEAPQLVADEWSILGRCITRGETGPAAAARARLVADHVAGTVRTLPEER